ELAFFGKEGTRIPGGADMRDRALRGTMDWTQQQVVADVPADATAIGVVIILYGKGELWCDDVQLQSVGPEVALTDDHPWHKFSYTAANYTAAADPAVSHNSNQPVCIASTPQATDKQWISYNREEPDIAK